MPRIFISYRRDDSIAITGRIYDRLVTAFGAENIFKDVDRIPPGSTFSEVLEKELVHCNVLLIVIGKQWVTITDKEGRRRLDNPEDFVRIEVERGLVRRDMLVIPVLVDGADVPNTADLPDTMDRLSSLQVVQVRHDPDFHRDMNRLVEFLRVLQTQEEVAENRAQKDAKRSVRRVVVAAVALVMLLIASLIGLFASGVLQTNVPGNLETQAILLLATTQQAGQMVTLTAEANNTLGAIMTRFVTETAAANAIAEVNQTSAARAETGTAAAQQAEQTRIARSTATAEAQLTQTHQAAVTPQDADSVALTATYLVELLNETATAQVGETGEPPVPTDTPEPGLTALPVTDTPEPTATPTPLPTDTAAPTETATFTATFTLTATLQPTATPTPSLTPTLNATDLWGTVTAESAGQATAFAEAQSIAATQAAGGGQTQLMSLSAPDCEYGGKLRSIEAIDTLTVQLTLCRPDVGVPFQLALPAFGIYPSEYLEATGGGGDLITRAVGTGPYQFVDWLPGETIRLNRYDGYWGEPALEETITFRWSADLDARLAALESGEADGTHAAVTDDLSSVPEDVTVYSTVAVGVGYLGMNSNFDAFGDLRVRQAVSYAIDRQAIIDLGYPPGAFPATQLVPPGMVGYTPEVEAFPYDPDMARQLLAEAGYPDGFSTTLYYRDVVRSYLPQPVNVAELIQMQLKEVRINVTLEVMESGDFFTQVSDGSLSMFLLGYVGDYPHGLSLLDGIFGQAAAFGTLDQGIADEMDPLWVRGFDSAAFVPLNTIIRDQAPVVPLAHGSVRTLYSPDIQGGHVSAMGLEHLAEIDDLKDGDLAWWLSFEPLGLYCADEFSGDSFLICTQINESLFTLDATGYQVEPGLVQSWEVSDDGLTWTFHLRESVTFHDGSTLDANDVALSFIVQWDASHPLHLGREGFFDYFSFLFGTLNAGQ